MLAPKHGARADVTARPLLTSTHDATDELHSALTPSRPLLTQRSVVKLPNGHQNNGRSMSRSQSSYCSCEHKYNSSKPKRRKRFWRGREHLCCLLGTVTCLLGAIFFCVGLMLFINSRAVTSARAPCLGASTGQSSSDDHTVSSPVKNASQVKSDVISSSTSTVPTTTFNYGKSEQRFLCLQRLTMTYPFLSQL